MEKSITLEEKFLDECLDLAAAIADREPWIAEKYLTSEDWLGKYVEGFESAYKKWEEHKKKAEVLIRNRIIYSNGKLTELGKDMICKLRSEAEQSKSELEELKEAEQELYVECERSFLADTTAGIAPGWFMFPTYLVSYKRIKDRAAEKGEKIEKINRMEAKLNEICQCLKKKNNKYTFLRKACAMAGASLLAFGALAGVAGDEDKDSTKSIQSRTGFNPDAYDYSLPLDQQHPIKPIINTSAKEINPAIYEDNVGFARYDSANKIWFVWVKNITSGKEQKLFSDSLYSPRDSNTAIFGNRVISGFGSLDVHYLKANKTDYYAIRGFDFDLWGDKLVVQRLHSRDPETGDYKSDIFLHNLTTGKCTKLTNGTVWQDRPTLYKNTMIWSGEGILSMDLSTKKTNKLNVPVAFPESLDLFNDKLLVGSYTYGDFVYNLTTNKKTPLFTGEKYIGKPKIYGPHIVWDQSNDIYMMELDKWLPQLNLPKELTAIEGHPFVYQVNASHPTSPVLNFKDDTSLFDIGSDTGKISFTPRKVGTYPVNITVIDSDGHKVTKQTKIVVKPNLPPGDNKTKDKTGINQPPVFVDLPDRIDVRTDVRCGDVINRIVFSEKIFYTAKAKDADGDKIIYGLRPTKDLPHFKNSVLLPPNSIGITDYDTTIYIDKNTGKMGVDGIAWDGAYYNVIVTASDGKATVNKTVDVLFKLNHPPEIRSVNARIIDPELEGDKIIGGKLEVDIDAYDVDGDKLRYEFTKKTYTCSRLAEDGPLECYLYPWDNIVLPMSGVVNVTDGIETVPAKFRIERENLEYRPPETPIYQPIIDAGNSVADFIIDAGNSAAGFVKTNWIPLATLTAVGAVAAGTYKGVRAVQRARKRRRKIVERAKKLSYPNRGLYEV